MPENPIHPGRNSTNTSKVPPETNLGQSALKSCLIYTHFSLALKPLVPVLHPLPSPTGQGGPALSHPTHPPTPPPARCSGARPCCHSAEHRGRRLKAFSLPSRSPSSSPVLQKTWHQPGYDNDVTVQQASLSLVLGRHFLSLHFLQGSQVCFE